MTYLKFSLTSQCHKATILRIVFKNQKVNSPGKDIVQQPVNADLRKLGVRTAGPNVYTTSHIETASPVVLKLRSIEPLGLDGAVSGVRRRSFVT